MFANYLRTLSRHASFYKLRPIYKNTQTLKHNRGQLPFALKYPMVMPAFSTLNMNQLRYFSGQAAMTQLEYSFTHNVYQNFQHSDLSFDSLITAMHDISKKDLSYHEFNEFYPMADELGHYLDQAIEERGSAYYLSIITADQATNLLKFALKFGIGLDSLMKLALDALEQDHLLGEMKPLQIIHIMNLLKEEGRLTQSLLVSMLQNLLKSASLNSLTPSSFSILLIILRSDEVTLAFKN